MSEHVGVYVSKEQKDRWQRQADEMGMSLSSWGAAMIEAGLKEFTRDVEPDKTREDLRRENRKLRQSLRNHRDLVSELEAQLHRGEREDIIEYVDKNPGTEFRDIVQHVCDTATRRVSQLLDELEGVQLEINEQGEVYYIDD